MTVTIHDPQTFFDVVTIRLLTTGKNIGEGEAPADTTTPYGVLYPLDEEDIESSLGDPSMLTVFSWEVVSVGKTLDEAHWMQQKVRSVMLGWAPSVSGVTCGQVLRDGGRPVQREDPLQPPRFSAVDVFTSFAN